jgi:GH15 family glucan-1,4-alpha-glucosidase
MPLRIEDYGLIGDCQAAALVGRDGSIDWLCLPRFDSPACFAALLGRPEHGRWLIAPAGEVRKTSRRYRGESLVLETEYETAEGTVAIIDCMPVRVRAPDLVRVVEGRRGQVRLKLELILRFDYGSIIPWVQRTEDGLSAIAGPDRVQVRSPVPLVNENFTTTADFTVSAGQRLAFRLTWHPSHEPPPTGADATPAVSDTEAWWQEWAGRCTYRGPWRQAVVRSLIILKAMTYAPTGGIVAAPTTSLPEQLGGTRNWDYRFCWLRDATFTLFALLNGGHAAEARDWRDWLLRAVAGRPAEAQIMYGLAGERRLTELVLDWLPGYEGARPVRIGNAASRQFQLDVYGEVIDALYHARALGLEHQPVAWALARTLLNFLETAWRKPDEGIWEVRGPRRHFTHSKIMAWVAVDRVIKAVENFRLDGPVEHWRQLRDAIHEQVCQQGFDPKLNSFVQCYDSQELDASLLMIPLVGFLPVSDPRMLGTVAAIEKRLMRDGLVFRYSTAEGVDGLPEGEGAFLACTFWLADNYLLMGRHADARRAFDRVLGLCNDVGLLSEEYDPVARRLVGNFPQAFSHVGLVNTAMNLSPAAATPAEQRPSG